MMSSNLVSPVTGNQVSRPSDGYGAPLAPPSSSYGPPSNSPPSASYGSPTAGRPGSSGGRFPGGGGGTFGGGRDVREMIEGGVSDAFCASARSFNTRNAKILFDETLFEKGKMFSLADGDFEVCCFMAQKMVDKS